MLSMSTAPQYCCSSISLLDSAPATTHASHQVLRLLPTLRDSHADEFDDLTHLADLLSLRRQEGIVPAPSSFPLVGKSVSLWQLLQIRNDSKERSSLRDHRSVPEVLG